MKLETFFEHFDLLTDAPNAAAKLREIILQLAVQGKLVPQDPNDEPASVLITEIVEERNRLIAEKKVNNYKPQPPIEGVEITFELPTGWACVRLGEITDLVSGVTKGRNLIGRKTTSYPYLRVANVQRGFLELKVMKEIEILIEELIKYQLRFGDILLTEGGDWDKLGRSAIWKEEIANCIHQNHVFRARPLTKGLLSEWVVMYTNSPVGRQYFETAAKRTTNLASINMTQLRYCPLPLPPLAEQKRIVEKVDLLLILCDAIDKHQQQRQQNLLTINDTALAQLLAAPTPDDFQHHWQGICNNFDLLYSTPETIPKLRQAILQLAVQGKLVPQDPDDEDLTTLLEKIAKYRDLLIQNKTIRKRKPLPPVDDREKIFKIPETWKWVRLGDLGDWGAGATPDRKRPEYYDGSIYWFKSGELNDAYIGESEEMITDLALKECSLRENKPGDILIAMYGATIGKVAVLETHATTNQAVCACTCFEGVHNLFLLLLLKAYKDLFSKQGTGGAQPNISREKIILTAAPLPPLAEQKRIVAKVDSLLALCDTLETKLKAVRDSSTTLMDIAARQIVMTEGS